MVIDNETDCNEVTNKWSVYLQEQTKATYIIMAIDNEVIASISSDI